MLKVLAAVLAVLSAAISITIYTATLPAVQKQAEDNAAAIETLGGSVSDNAEAIETLKSVKLYEHSIKIEVNNYSNSYLIIYNNNNTLINTIDLLKAEIGEYNYIPCTGYLTTAQGQYAFSEKVGYYYSGGGYIFSVTGHTTTGIEVNAILTSGKTVIDTVTRIF